MDLLFFSPFRYGLWNYGMDFYYFCSLDYGIISLVGMDCICIVYGIVGRGLQTTEVLVLCCVQAALFADCRLCSLQDRPRKLSAVRTGPRKL